MIAPEHVAVMATVGCTAPRVSRRPKAGIISTGDELVDPAMTPAPSQIRESNGAQLVAQVRRAGAAPAYYGIAPDTEEALGAIVAQALAENDVVLLSGGVSMGDFDLVPGILTAKGMNILFDAIAMKPGKPTTFAVSGNRWCFGLPGNPVSTFVQFELLVRPFLYRLMGHEEPAPYLYLPLEAPLSRKKADRLAWLPVRFTESGGLRLCDYHGSAHVSGLCPANGLMAFPLGETALEKGALARVRPI